MARPTKRRRPATAPPCCSASRAALPPMVAQGKLIDYYMENAAMLRDTMLERTFGQRECIIALLCEIIKSFICKYAQEAGLLLSSLQFFKRPITNEPLDDRLIN